MPANSSTAAQFGQRVLERLRRIVDSRGSSPFRLRIALLITVVVALTFAVLGAYGVNKRRSSIDDARHAAAQLTALQDISVAVVQADSVASQSYLVGGQETPTQRTLYLGYVDKASSGLIAVALQLDLDTAQTTALESVGTSLSTYTGLVEQARANNRQGFPVGAAYQRQANALVSGPLDGGVPIVEALRVVQEGQRSVVNDDLAAAHRAGVWLVTIGWALVVIVVLGGVWLALRFRRFVNVPLGIAALALLAMVIAGGAAQSRSINDADNAVGGALTNADLVAQARAGAYDAASQEALTLINRGNGQANEAAWQASSTVVETALQRACDGDDVSCPLRDLYSSYATGHTAIRGLDDAGNWDAAVAVSLGTPYAADPSIDTTEAVKPFNTFATKSEQVVGDSATSARDELLAATDRLALTRILVLVAGLLVAVLAFIGYGQRLREYR